MTIPFAEDEGRAMAPARPFSSPTPYLGVTRKMPHSPLLNWKLSCVR
jgi:hypothetical protein